MQGSSSKCASDTLCLLIRCRRWAILESLSSAFAKRQSAKHWVSRRSLPIGARASTPCCGPRPPPSPRTRPDRRRYGVHSPATNRWHPRSCHAEFPREWRVEIDSVDFIALPRNGAGASSAFEQSTPSAFRVSLAGSPSCWRPRPSDAVRLRHIVAVAPEGEEPVLHNPARRACAGEPHVRRSIPSPPALPSRDTRHDYAPTSRA